MVRYVVRRVLESLPTLFGITLVSFILVHLVPGGPAYAMLGPKASPQMVAKINHLFGLDQPLPVQYVAWIWQVMHGNLGISYFQQETVWSLIWQAAPRTLAIVGLSALFAHLISIVSGVLQAYRRESIFDHTVTAASYFFYSMPLFWLGILLIIVFSIDFSWFPPGGIEEPGQTVVTFGSWAAHVTLPIATIVIGTVAYWGRFMRAAVVDTLVQDYIRTARAKGLGEGMVLFKHALRNSLLPLITLLGLSIPHLFAGALLVEEIFNYPGLGLLFWTAAIQRDYPVVLGGIVITGFLTVLGNIIADVLYAFVDPRIQYS